MKKHKIAVAVVCVVFFTCARGAVAAGAGPVYIPTSGGNQFRGTLIAGIWGPNAGQPRFDEDALDIVGEADAQGYHQFGIFDGTALGGAPSDSLGGTLQIDVFGGYVPLPADEFRIFEAVAVPLPPGLVPGDQLPAGNFTGWFDTVALDSGLTGDWFWRWEYMDHSTELGPAVGGRPSQDFFLSATLTMVSEPGTIVFPEPAPIVVPEPDPIVVPEPGFEFVVGIPPEGWQPGDDIPIIRVWLPAGRLLPGWSVSGDYIYGHRTDPTYWPTEEGWAFLGLGPASGLRVASEGWGPGDNVALFSSNDMFLLSGGAAGSANLLTLGNQAYGGGEVPEPGTLVLLISGALGLLLLVWRRRRRR